jgi:hypothetical protein
MIVVNSLWKQQSGTCVLLVMFELFAICLQFVRSFVHRGGLLVLLYVDGF